VKRGILSFLFIVLSLQGADGKFLVGFAQDTMGNDWRVAQVKEVEEELKKQQNIEFIYTDANGDFAKQIYDIEELVKKGIDILITSPKNSKAMAPVIKKVYESGIPVILISRGVEGGYYTTFIRPDNKKIGKESAKFIAKELGGKGNVLILQHTPTTTPAIERTEGFLDEIKNYPSIHIVGTKVANSLRSEAILQTENAIKEGLSFDAIYAQSDSMATGARVALKKNGIDPKNIVITGIDYIKESRDAIKNGEQRASFLYQTAGKEGAQAAIDILNKKTVQKEVILETTIITKDNVDEIEPIF